MEDLTFQQAKEVYAAARKHERQRIRQALKDADFEVTDNGPAGQGRKDYTSGSRLDPSFDLSNWMWVEAERNGVSILVNLQVLDQDPKSHNIHALVDRIGIEVGDRSDDAPLFENCTTKFTLPLDDTELSELVEIIQSKTENTDE